MVEFKLLDIEEFQSRIKSFPSRYMRNFDYIWKWKIKVELNSVNHILDSRYRKETYQRLCKILPRWQTYRNGKNANSLRTLKESIANISEAYNQLRNITLLDFDDVAFEPLEKIWHELGRVKEHDGNRNINGYYSIISVCKPLLLIWGQTLAFDSYVRKHLPRNYNVPRYSARWSLKQWILAMRKFSGFLEKNRKLLDFMRKESRKRYGRNAVVPYGRFLDIYYWQGS